jgi:hypothetical protein
MVVGNDRLVIVSAILLAGFVMWGNPWESKPLMDGPSGDCFAPQTLL